jgi:hypothetical protein
MVRRVVASVVATLAFHLIAFAEGEFGILSFPIGLVVGEQTIEVDLGPSGEPASLYLDSEPVCRLTASIPRCQVDLGETPDVHLLELVQRNGEGEIIASARRWVNRPGQEAELSIRLDRAPSIGVCTGRVQWFHPDKADPIVLEVTDDGRPLLIGGDRHSFQFRCADSDEPRVIGGSAIFPDGRRAEAVAVSDTFGCRTETSLTSVPLVAAGQEVDPCSAVASALGDGFETVENSGFEVVFVLDPSANSQYLMSSGWSKVRLPTGSTVKVNPDYFRDQLRGGGAEAKDSWNRAVGSLTAAEKMWHVLPDNRLQRVNGFSRGKDAWLLLLFQLGSIEAVGTPRIADAVAASGLVAAAGPRRRAVVLILGKKSGRDASEFSPRQAQDYLAEVGVPLFVLRSGKPQDDGWPGGVQIKNMEAMAAALNGIRNTLNQQCVVWFEGDVSLARITSELRDGLAIAGRPTGVVDPDANERQATAEATDQQSPDAPALEARVDVTAVTVLVAARDSSGRPITDLRATDISVTEDGRQATVLDLDPLTGVVALQPTGFSTTGADQMAPERQTEVGELRVAIFADLEFSGGADLFAAVDLLAERSDWLSSLGPVSIVEAQDGLRTVLDGSRDAEQIRSALLELAEARSGPGEIDQIRTRFLRENGPMRDQGASINPSEEGLIPSVRFAIHEEDHAVRRHLDRIQYWAEAESATNPGLLLLVGAGFDEDPREFYQPTVERRSPENASKVNLESRDLGVRRSVWVEDLGRELAAGGWLVVPFVGRSVGMGGSSIASEHSGRGRLNEFYSNRGTGVGTFTPSWLQVNPLGSQRHLAAPSSGGVVLSKKDLNMIIEQSGGWYQLTYQVDRPPAGIYRELNVTTTRDDAVLQTTGVVLSGTSEGRSEARLRQLLDGSGSAGELPVDVSISEPRLGEDQVLVADATVAVSFAPIAPLFVEGGERPLRFSIAVQAGNEDPVIQHELETAIGLLGGMYFDFPIEWSVPPETLAVIVEDLKSGAWGGWKSDLSELAARDRGQR